MGQEEQDMRERLQNLLAAGLGTGLIALLILGVFTLLALFGGGVMSLFGLEYVSVGSFLLFFLLSALAGFPLELLASALPRALFSLGRLSRRAAILLFLLLDTLSSCLSMSVLDWLIDGVWASPRAILAVSLAFALLSLSDFREKLSRDARRSP